jgi:hypothetical protein
MDIVSNADAGAESQMRFLTATSGSNPAVALTINALGNLGLGVASINEKLMVNGAIVTNSFLNNNQTSSSVFDFYLGTARIFSYGASGVNGNIGFYTASAGSSASETMRITGAGELCVGRTTAYGAGFLVNVEGNIYASAAIVAGSSVTAATSTNASFIATTSSASGYSYIDFANTGASGKTYEIGIGGNSAASGYANNLYFDLVGVGTIMTMTSSRNVGIGTTSPGSALDVVGTIRTRTSSGAASLLLQDGSASSKFEIGHLSNALYFYNYIAGATGMTIKSNNIINLSNVPSSASGLSSGDIYKTVAGVLMIV